MTKALAVVGCGPKGAAIAAKAASLKAAGYSAPDVTIYEAYGPGAAWSGKHGYTNGEQPLCTAAERDVGFPYSKESFGKRVAEHMLASFSWQNFCVNSRVDANRYDNWVAKGRRSPSHKLFSEYVAYAADKSNASLVLEAVTGIDFDRTSSKWIIETARGSSGPAYDGVVLTGTGEPKPPLPNANGRVFDGRDFWRSGARIVSLLRQEKNASICIIGAGGTAAAIANWLIGVGLGHIKVLIVAPQPTLHGRTENFFESRLFTDRDAWRQLTPYSQTVFLSRLDRGVVWQNVLDGLKDLNMRYLSYRVRGFSQISLRPPVGTDPYLEVDLDEVGPPSSAAPRSPPAHHEFASIFVDARGFDPLWFVEKLISPGSAIQAQLRTWKGHMERLMDSSLAVSVSGSGFPSGLHIPVLAFRQGPAASNLMALGWMSDQILNPYIPPSEIMRLANVP